MHCCRPPKNPTGRPSVRIKCEEAHTHNNQTESGNIVWKWHVEVWGVAVGGGTIRIVDPEAHDSGADETPTKSNKERRKDEEH